VNEVDFIIVAVRHDNIEAAGEREKAEERICRKHRRRSTINLRALTRDLAVLALTKPDKADCPDNKIRFKKYMDQIRQWTVGDIRESAKQWLTDRGIELSEQDLTLVAGRVGKLVTLVKLADILFSCGDNLSKFDLEKRRSILAEYDQLCVVFRKAFDADGTSRDAVYEKARAELLEEAEAEIEIQVAA